MHLFVLGWSKEFLEAGKKRLQGDTIREATSSEVGDLKNENGELKHLVAKATPRSKVKKVEGKTSLTCEMPEGTNYI